MHRRVLNLGNEERQHLKNKFKPFDLEIDMANPTFKVGMTFSGVEELRKALAAYSIRNRVCRCLIDGTSEEGSSRGEKK
jgi:hypothetical protein